MSSRLGLRLVLAFTAISAGVLAQENVTGEINRRVADILRMRRLAATTEDDDEKRRAFRMIIRESTYLNEELDFKSSAPYLYEAIKGHVELTGTAAAYGFAGERLEATVVGPLVFPEIPGPDTSAGALLAKTRWFLIGLKNLSAETLDVAGLTCFGLNAGGERFSEIARETRPPEIRGLVPPAVLAGKTEITFLAIFGNDFAADQLVIAGIGDARIRVTLYEAAIRKNEGAAGAVDGMLVLALKGFDADTDADVGADDGRPEPRAVVLSDYTLAGQVVETLEGQIIKANIFDAQAIRGRALFVIRGERIIARLFPVEGEAATGWRFRMTNEERRVLRGDRIYFMRSD